MAAESGLGLGVGRVGLLRVLAVGGAGVLLAGCASMPDRGDVTPVEASQHADTQVRVFGVPPREGAQPEEIINGFLEATTGDEPEFATAKLYLTTQARKVWKPSEVTTVLADGPNQQATSGRGRDAESMEYRLRGSEVATVDEHDAYSPASGSYDRIVRLTKENGEWRISSLPQGVVLGESDFLRIYHSVSKYYFAAGGTAGARPWLVADPVYVRQYVDPVTETVNALLAGPTSWLAPVVSSGFPSGAALKKDTKSLVLDDRNALTVPLNVSAAAIGAAQCKKMATQLMFTLLDLTSSRIEQVLLDGADGSHLCQITADQAKSEDPNSLGAGVSQYYVTSQHHLARLEETGTRSIVVSGPLGEGDFEIGSVAVAHDEERAAAVSANGKELYVESIVAAGELGEPKIVSAGTKDTERLSAPSWDGNGDLWVADRNPADPQLLRLVGGAGTPEPVQIAGLAAGATVTSLRVAVDGVRIALLIEEGGKTSLRIGRIERQSQEPSGQSSERLTVVDLRAVAPQMSEVTAMSWAGSSRLVVAGREAGGVQQLRYVQTDGSAVTGTLPGVNRVTGIAASDDDRLPLVAHSDEDGIVRLPTGANWQTVVKDGSMPVYPG